MAKTIHRTMTTTVTEEIVIVPETPGEEIGHRVMTVGGYGEYKSSDGGWAVKPQINLNAKWLAEAGFVVGEKIDVEVKENELVIRKLAITTEA